MTDIDLIRNDILRLHSLAGTAGHYTIYYDESNNIRKLRLTDKGLNIGEPVCFALAGVFHEGNPRPINFGNFRAAARIPDSVEEVKLRTLAFGDFLRCMGSKKIEAFLDWMQDEGLLIHYQSTDVLYWSIVDIIDSLGKGGIVGRQMDVDMTVKNALYDVLRTDLPATAALLHGFDYPNVGRARRVDFLNSLIARVEKDRRLIRADLRTLLLSVLRDARELPSLPFLEGEAAGLLIGTFRDFYLNRIALFNNSRHILDEESEIEQALSATGWHSAGQPVSNYCFVDSKVEPGIQASDVIAGITAKLFDYVIRTPAPQITKELRSANPRQSRNIASLRMLAAASIDVSPAFAHVIMSLEDRMRASIVFD